MNDEYKICCILLKTFMCDLLLKVIGDYTCYGNHFEVLGTDLTYDLSDDEKILLDYFELFLKGKDIRK